MYPDLPGVKNDEHFCKLCNKIWIR